MRRAALVLAVLAAIVPLGVRSSGATFVASSANPGSSFSTAAAFDSVTLSDPGSPLRRAVTLAAAASGPAGVASVTIARRPTSGGSWGTICTDSTSPYSCRWATTTLGDGLYDLRATALDSLGHSSISASVGSREVDNTVPAAVDIQAANAAGTAGTTDAGDTLTLTYGEAMAPAAILAGWSAAAAAVTVRVTDARFSDTLSIWNAANTQRVNLTAATRDIRLNADRTKSGATFSARIDRAGPRIVITLLALTGGDVKASAGTTAMRWVPSTIATDLAGNRCALASATEAGPADVDF